MKLSGKNMWQAISFTVIALLMFFLWLNLRPVKIIAVHKSDNFSNILVDHFPLTVRGKIAWWQKNKAMLKSCYGIPDASSDGGYHVTFWLFGDGYMEQGKYDRLCFSDMKAKKNCIEKNKTLTVDNSKNTGIFFTTHAGYHRINDKGEIVEKRFY